MNHAEAGPGTSDADSGAQPSIDAHMRDIVDRAMLSFAATVCPDGSPNLSPKGSVRVYDDHHLIFMNIASPTTVANLRRDPRIEINSIDVFRRRGYRFKGRAEIVPPGHPAYEWLNAWLLEVNGPGYPAHEAVLIQVERILPVLSPAYTWGGATEEALAAAWWARYQQAAGPQARRRPPGEPAGGNHAGSATCYFDGNGNGRGRGRGRGAQPGCGLDGLHPAHSGGIVAEARPGADADLDDLPCQDLAAPIVWG